MLLDENFRHRVRNSTRDIHRELGLSIREWNSLRSIPEQHLGEAISTLPKKRLRRLRAILPNVHMALGYEFDSLFKVFASEILTRDEMSETKSFLELLSAMSRLGKIKPFIVDLGRYDRIILELSSVKHIDIRGDTRGKWKPKLSSSCRILSTRYDVAVILNRLKAKKRLKGIRKGEYYFLVRKTDDVVKLFGLPAWAFEVLAKCNGLLTIDNLERSVNRLHIPSGISLRTALSDFRNRGFLA